MRHPHRLSLAPLLFTAAAIAQQQGQRPHPAATLGLLGLVPWQTDGSEFFDQGGDAPLRVELDRGKLVDAACARAKQEHKLVLWYVHRIGEQSLQGRQMYRAPVLDIYMQQVVFADADVGALAAECFVPLRCALDEPLSARFGLRPLEFVEPAVVFLDGDGKVVHFVERFRTFHAQWFADLLVRLLDQQQIPRQPGDLATMRRRGLWRAGLAQALAAGTKDAATWLQIAGLQRLLMQPTEALASLDQATTAAQAEAAAAPAGEGDAAERPRRRRGRVNQQLLGDIACERGLVLTMTGKLLDAQPVLEQAFRSGAGRAAEAGYWHAWNSLQLGDEIGALRRFTIVATRYPETPFGRRARANSVLGPDDRPIGAAFTGFESVGYLPDQAYRGLPKDTTWNGDPLQPKALAKQALLFLLRQQHDDGGFTDSRYAYWPSSEITPNVWVAVTAIALTALLEHRAAFPELQPRIDAALSKGEGYILDPKRLHRGANEDCYSDAYRLLYLSRRANAADGAAKQEAIAAMNEIVAQAASRQQASGFWAHEYENAFATGAVAQELLAARAAGATVPAEVTDKAAGALLSARFKNGAYVYGGAADGAGEGPLKDAAGRMPVCEGALLQLGRSDVDKVRFALQNFWTHMERLERVRRNDFHSDGELAGFFFFHSVYHGSEVVKLLPADEQPEHWQRFTKLLQEIPELDGSFVDSHELGRSYGTAMALLTLRNAADY